MDRTDHGSLHARVAVTANVAVASTPKHDGLKQLFDTLSGCWSSWNALDSSSSDLDRTSTPHLLPASYIRLITQTWVSSRPVPRLFLELDLVEDLYFHMYCYPMYYSTQSISQLCGSGSAVFVSERAASKLIVDTDWRPRVACLE